MNDHVGRESACGREMGNNEFSWSGLNDLPSCLLFSNAFIYADDTKCLRHRSGSNATEMNLLQKDLDNLFQWGYHNI